MNTQWIKTADRAPTEADLPVIFETTLKLDAGRYYVPAHSLGALDGLKDSKKYPRWMHIPEPPKEETQAGRDIDAFAAWSKCPPSGYLEPCVAWHAALAYERAEVAKMLPYFNCTLPLEVGKAIEAIRARCGGGGQ